jgi:hypothetical protein
MSVTTYEGLVENGLVRLPDGAHIPDNTKVYVVVPSGEESLRTRIASPRLKNPEQANDFTKLVEEVPEDAGL